MCVCVFEILLSCLLHLEQADKNSLKQKASSPQGKWEGEKEKDFKTTWKLPSALMGYCEKKGGRECGREKGREEKRLFCTLN